MDEATYIAVSEQHMASFFRTAYSILKKRHDAEDAVQQALLNAWKSRDKVREGAERAWMMRILINECTIFFASASAALDLKKYQISQFLLLLRLIRACMTQFNPCRKN